LLQIPARVADAGGVVILVQPELGAMLCAAGAI